MGIRQGGPKNYITAEAVRGIYKGKQVELRIGKSANDTTLLINGKKIRNCQAAYLRIMAGEPTRLTLVLWPGLE